MHLSGMVTWVALFTAVLIFALGFKVLLTLFVYSDAKERSGRPVLWAVLVFFVPMFIGLLFYFLVGRNRAVVCPSCFGTLRQGSGFCPHCGRPVAFARAAGLTPASKGLLIGALVFLALLLVGVGFIIAFSVM